ncbi:UMP-CMP kinase [Fomitiporia mediterranea MF3/22]|uniref:UMP-CMP kinase n=1 Tax=Fomitiporia mediterranea (strain MF3/22) TaxID=694068 RepID=UPI0004409C1E|nr:UMP-CMP kinase [Fomitiporia mediterranea MF3/22]EJD05656.1 UMP-CMP kinase [Fomitiporia mediterranea MF3/22]
MSEPVAPNSTNGPAKKPAFDHEKVTVVFVLGGPGAGKGTQSERLVQQFGFSHLSAGDLLRAEQHRSGSEFGELIRTHIREGTIVPMEITVKLLENAMKAEIKKREEEGVWSGGKGRFLIDGFPRKMDQALKFEEDVCLASLVLFFETTEEVMLRRLLERGKTSGREDDNVESITKRFNTYKQQTMPVVEYYAAQGKVAQVDSTRSIEEVYRDAAQWIESILKKDAS